MHPPPSRKKKSVIAIIFDKNQILLIKRRDIPVWVLPGGGVEQAETPEEAVIREVQEETGLKVSIIRLVALYTPVNRLTNDTYVYECRPAEGNLTTGSETADVRFFPFSNLPSSLFFLHQEWLDDARKNLPYPIQKPLSQITYLALFKYFCRHPLQVLRLILSRLGCPLNNRQ
jgi:8-oxo-dGTP diphosphatase